MIQEGSAMFGKILLDDDDWFVTVELSGRFNVTLKVQGFTREASKEEGLHFIRVLECVADLGISIEPGNEGFKELVRDFSESFFSNGDAMWRAFFQTPPGEVALRCAHPLKRVSLN